MTKDTSTRQYKSDAESAPQPARMTKEEFRRQRRGRNIAIAVALVGLVVLFYFVTIARMGGA